MNLEWLRTMAIECGDRRNNEFVHPQNLRIHVSSRSGGDHRMRWLAMDLMACRVKYTYAEVRLIVNPFMTEARRESLTMVDRFCIASLLLWSIASAFSAKRIPILSRTRTPSFISK